MDNLVKALKCYIMCDAYDCEFDCPDDCPKCEYYQTEYKDIIKSIVAASDKITVLQKSNRNWRRKVQRLRKLLKEAKKNGIS